MGTVGFPGFGLEVFNQDDFDLGEDWLNDLDDDLLDDDNARKKAHANKEGKLLTLLTSLLSISFPELLPQLTVRSFCRV